jgi:hypothetical protein
MNLDLIRAIDKWVGIPACFAVSMAHKVRNYFKAQPGHEPRQGSRPKRLLFLELSEMGSAVLAYPAMKYVLRQYPGAELYFLIFEQNRFSVDMLNIIPGPCLHYKRSLSASFSCQYDQGAGHHEKGAS